MSDGLWEDTQGGNLERTEELLEEIIALLDSNEEGAVIDGLALAEELSSLRGDDESRVLIAKSHLLSQLAFLKIQAGATNEGYAGFYSLLKWDLNLSAELMPMLKVLFLQAFYDDTPIKTGGFNTRPQ